MVSAEEDRERQNGEPSDGDDAYVCEACGKEFPTEAELEEHVLEQGIVD